MIQCQDCEFFKLGPNQQRTFTCDPFVNIKEPECIGKWQIIRLNMLVASHQSMVSWQNKIAPLQDKMFRYMEREINEMDESESWKVDPPEEDPFDADPDSLQRRIIALRDAGVAFDACGVGADGLNDRVLEALTRKGDGRYYFLDHPRDADAGFVRQLAGALRPAAKNVKVQVKFNPKRARAYRLSGFEKHRLKKEDFRNDKVDAAEMAAEEAGNALYQVEIDPAGEGDVGRVFVRFRDLSSGLMVERSWKIPYVADAPRIEDATPSMQLATTATLLAEKLKGGPLAEGIELSQLAPVTASLRGGPFGGDERVQSFIQMFEKARDLSQ